MDLSFVNLSNRYISLKSKTSTQYLLGL